MSALCGRFTKYCLGRRSAGSICRPSTGGSSIGSEQGCSRPRLTALSLPDVRAPPSPSENAEANRGDRVRPGLGRRAGAGVRPAGLSDRRARRAGGKGVGDEARRRDRLVPRGPAGHRPVWRADNAIYRWRCARQGVAAFQTTHRLAQPVYEAHKGHPTTAPQSRQAVPPCPGTQQPCGPSCCPSARPGLPLPPSLQPGVRTCPTSFSTVPATLNSRLWTPPQSPSLASSCQTPTTPRSTPA